MLKKRIKYVFIFFVIIFVCLILRMLYLQVFASESLSKAASSQRMDNYNIDKPRGNILDRNEISFTNRTVKYTIVLKPIYLKNNKEGISAICNILGLDFALINKQLDSVNEPILIETDQEKKDRLMSLKINGVSAVYSLKRYEINSIAKHVLGYLNKKDLVGQIGIEKYFEGVLKDKSNNSVSIIKDAQNHQIKGMDYRINKESQNNNTLDVKLTLDFHIQKIVEDVMQRNGITGAVVVEDVNNGDIVALASKPDFDQDSVEKYLKSPGNELYNRAVASYNVGSIFKIIDAAVLLESSVNVSETYTCTGSIKVGGNIIKCSSFSKGGHGAISLKEAFAQSCNTYFISMCIKAGYEKLINMAQKFGLGSTTGIKEQGINESKGNLPSAGKHYSYGDIANLSIGQGVVMATPLQLADIVATVANGGIKNRLNIVDSIVDEEGKKVREIRIKEGCRIISKETSDTIKEMMEAVTDYGTGTAARLEKYGGAAGKTGSAQTGKKDIVHAWFAGYFPRIEPKYSIAVLVENGQYGGKAAAPIFAEIAEEIMKKGY